MKAYPQYTRLAVRSSTGPSGRHYITVKIEADGEPSFMTFQCDHYPGDLKFVWGGGLGQHLEIVEHDWMRCG